MKRDQSCVIESSASVAAALRERMKHLALLFVTTATLATLATLSYWNPYYVDARTKEKARQLDAFCAKTRDAMLADNFAFEHGDDRERAEARRRFYASTVMYHNSQSVEFCLPRLPRAPSACFLGDDWKCLADFAGSLAQSIWRTTGRTK